MDLPTFRKSETATNRPPTPPVTLPTSIQLEHYSRTPTPLVRETRSTHFASSMQKPALNPALMPTQPLSQMSTLKPRRSDILGDRRIVSVSISSSVAETHRIYSPRTSSTTERAETTTVSPVGDFDDGFFAAEERQSLVAEANKHEFSVEEPEPITKNADALVEELPANVQAIPVIKKLSDFEKTSELLKELSQDKLKDKLPPFHHTIIYHDSPNEQMAARSVSYSTVIQTVPGESMVKRWKGRADMKEEAGSTQDSMSSDYNSGDYDENLEKNKENSDWESSETSTGARMELSEKNWGVQQKPYISKQNLPVIYGQAEENYEVDEAVSVQNNGRIHGIQPSQATQQEGEQKPAAKSKNGYVIEGRKERRYRVEERTPDGFIVGEFGIVNRDDGLLRGVRYTAEETINPKLIYDTLMKFLSL